MALKATKPEIKEKRLKMFVYGPPACGKTVAALQFKNAYIFDTEKGTDFYSELINKNDSAVFQSTNPDDIKEQLRELLTTKHHYKTIVIDPITQVYNAIQEKWNKTFEKYADSEKQKEVGDFGMRYWGKVKGEFKSIQRLLMQIDCNVIITSHQKDVYGAGFAKMGVTYDSMKGEDYLYDLVFHLEKKGKDRIAETIKERALPGQQKFPEEFLWSYENFLKFYGAEIIEKESTPVLLATKEQLERVIFLITTINYSQDEIDKVWKKYDIESWDEMESEVLDKFIKHLEKKISDVVQPKEKK